MVMNSIFRYFVLPESQISGHKADLIPDNDLLSLSNLKVIKYPYPTADGRYIVKAELPGYVVQTMVENCRDMGIADPLTMEGLAALDILGSYAGETREDVLARFPELAGQVQVGVDEEGNPVMVDKFPLKKWSCEE